MFGANLALAPVHNAQMVEAYGSKSWITGDPASHRILTVAPDAGRSMVLLFIMLGHTPDAGGIQGVHVKAEVNGSPVQGFHGVVDTSLHQPDAQGYVRSEVYIYVPDGGSFTLDVQYGDADAAQFTARVRGLEVPVPALAS